MKTNKEFNFNGVSNEELLERVESTVNYLETESRQYWKALKKELMKRLSKGD